MKILGTVRWFNDERGYGFIMPDDKKHPDCFVHYSAIEMEGRKTLAPKQRVEFKLSLSLKGVCATNVVPVNE